MPDDPRYYMDFTGTGNSLNAVHPSVLRLIMDSLRYWVIECHVDGFRFDLASALARELLRRRPPARVLRHHPPGPGALAGQADRRAVGRRPGRLPGRQLPGAVERVERHLPRRRARLLARRRRSVAEFASRFTGSSDLYESDGAPAVRVDQLHHRPRRLHAARPRLLQREAQRGQPRGQPRRHRRQPLVELRRRGRDRRPRDQRAARAASSATSSRRCCSRQGVPMLLGGDEFGRTQGGNNNAWCQDNEISWFDWELRRRRRRAARLHAAADRACAATTRSSAAASSSPGASSEGSGLPDVWWFRPDGRRMTQRDWDAASRTSSACSSTARRSPTARRSGEHDRRRLVPAAVQRPPRGRDVHAARRAASARAWTHELCTADPDAAPGVDRLRGARRAARAVALDEAAAAGRREGAPTGSSSGRSSTSPPSRELVPYLRDLGVSHLYLSPSLQARAGLDARLRRRRPDARLGRARRRGGPARARAAARPGDRARHRPQPHGRRATRTAGGPTRRCARGSSTSTRETGWYRRFFDIDDLAGVRVEDPEVFDRHARQGPRARRATGVVDGLRVDHPDGLADPAGYLRRLRDARRGARLGREDPRTPASRCATGRSRARSATSSSTTRRRCSSTRPARPR